MISGGQNRNGYLDSTEIFDPKINSFVPFKDLPVKRRYHDVVAISDSKAILLGCLESCHSTHIFDANDENWTEGPTLSTAREDAFAGLVTFKNGTKAVLVVGGKDENSSEFLHLDSDR